MLPSTGEVAGITEERAQKNDIWSDYYTTDVMTSCEWAKANDCTYIMRERYHITIFKKEIMSLCDRM
jgi:hypothetical protein